MDRDSHTEGCMNRRRFLLLAAAAMAATASQAAGDNRVPAGKERTVDTGPEANYATNGVYAGFRAQGFFIIRKGEKLFALSAICTHKKCKLAAEPDRSFYCECHGSTFDPGGKVTEGPAKRDLPVLPSFTNEKGHLIVKVPAV